MVNYNVTGSRRKQLVKKLESLLGERAVYLGMPTCGFKVGEYTVSKTGEITGAELSDEIKSSLARAGFVPVSETDESETAPEEKPKGLTFTIPLSELNGKAENFVNMLGVTNPIAFVVAFVGVQGAIEAVICCIVATAVSTTLFAVFRKNR